MNALTTPKHVAFIPDGNRRWAKRNNKDLADVYSISASLLDQMIHDMVDRGVTYVTVWPVSSRTFWRSKPEVDVILEAVRSYLSESVGSYLQRGYRFRVIGSLDRLREIHSGLCEAIEALERKTADQTRATVIMAFDYSGREELARAVRRLIQNGAGEQVLDAEPLRKYLDAPDIPDPDILIRTGGDRRLSGFLPYQTEYTELFFCDELLPDFKLERIAEIFDAFSKRRLSQ